MPLDKAKLGVRYTCFECGAKFYDLNRPEPMCPACNADQREDPNPDPIEEMLRSLSKRRRRKKKPVEEEVAKPAAAEPSSKDEAVAAEGDSDGKAKAKAKAKAKPEE